MYAFYSFLSCFLLILLNLRRICPVLDSNFTQASQSIMISFPISLSFRIVWMLQSLFFIHGMLMEYIRTHFISCSFCIQSCYRIKLFYSPACSSPSNGYVVHLAPSFFLNISFLHTMITWHEKFLSVFNEKYYKFASIFPIHLTPLSST